MATTPSAPAKKYDRQLRIWGAHGQQALETSSICVLGSGCTATETLKNLVLGGIAGFTVVDDATVQASDLGSNFLLERASLGKLRAEAVTGLLSELNEGVASSYVEESPVNLIETNPAFFSEFQLVLATQVQCSQECNVSENQNLAVPKPAHYRALSCRCGSRI
jgi:amyloid beta precursor protein binding protein 1